jgi:DNA repair exonuclease SbcCD ATPase subunit
MARVREHQEDKAEEQKVMKDLDECLSEYKSKYKKAKAEFDKLSKSFDKRMQYLQDQINILHNQLKEIDKKEINTENITGLQGKTLISCLITVRKFSHTITGGAAYAPLISILDGMSTQF